MDIGLVTRVLWRRRAPLRRQRWTRAQLLAYQAGALRRLREFACARSPFHRRFHRGCAGRPLSELPVLSKSTMMEHLDELATTRTTRDRVVVADSVQSRASAL